MKLYDIAFLLIGLIFLAGMLVGKKACACGEEAFPPPDTTVNQIRSPRV